MLRKPIFIILFSILIPMLHAQNRLQVVSEPNVVVYIDGKVSGFTSLLKGGLHLENMEAGNHKIILYKLHHIIQEDTVFIVEGNSNMFYAKPFVKNENDVSNNYLVSQNHPKGNLKIQSLPVGIVVEIPKLGLNSKKVVDKFMVSNVQEGSYEAIFTWNNKTVKHTIKISEGQETHLFVNMIKNEIMDKSLASNAYPQETSENSFTSHNEEQDKRIADKTTF